MVFLLNDVYYEHTRRIPGESTTYSTEKGQKDKQRSTKHTHKTKDWVPRTPLKTGGELMCSGRVSSFCSTRPLY
jgi:hypothetical protein